MRDRNALRFRIQSNLNSGLAGTVVGNALLESLLDAADRSDRAIELLRRSPYTLYDRERWVADRDVFLAEVDDT